MSLAFTFPGGIVYADKDTEVAGNQNTDIAVPANTNWIFQSLFVSLETDGTVANRTILVRTFNSANEILDAGIETGSITAGQTKSLSLTNQTNPSDDQGITKAGDYRGQFSFGGLLKAGDYIRIRIVSGVAGDQYQYRFRVRAIGWP